MPRKSKLKSEFLKEIVKKHNNIYDYSLVDYVNSKTNIKIICKIHGLFKQRADVHLLGRGCKKCARKKYLKLKIKNKGNEFLKKAKKKHGNLYDYSKVVYKTRTDKVIIICKKHGEFLQSMVDHISGHGCRECGKSIGNLKKMYTQNEALLKIKRIYKDTFLYDNFIYNGYLKKSKLTCRDHGDFEATYTRMLGGTSCPGCRRTFGEYQVAKWLDENDIEYIEQYSNETCKFKQKLRFDFLLPKFNIIIEYDGKQHFKEVKHFHDSLDSRILKDKIKNKWAKDNGYKMIRIPYKKIKKISEILNKEIKIIEEYESKNA